MLIISMLCASGGKSVLQATEGEGGVNSGRKEVEHEGVVAIYVVHDIILGYSVESIFRPTMEMTSVVMKKRRQKVAGSWKTKMPSSTEPRAPMPVHTG